MNLTTLLQMEELQLQNYAIVFNHADRLKQVIAKNKYSKIFILTDENTYQHCFPDLIKKCSALGTAQLINILAGEEYKALPTCEKIWSELLTKEADRKSLVINLGGGVVTDMGGFIASTYKRGIDFIQIPTSLLAMVDAAIGSKTGIDYKGYKNVIGLFSDPQLVWINISYLTTLPQTEILNGYAEIIKHALIADEDYWQKIYHVSVSEPLKDIQAIIYRSILIKKEIIEQDPYEKGIRKALNFGHTIGHAVETYFLNSSTPISHGHAVALGMICAIYISKVIQNFSEYAADQITQKIKSLYAYHQIKSDDYVPIMSLMKNDKKNEGGKISFTLLKEIGNPVVNQYVENKLIVEALAYYNSIYAI